MYIKGQPKDIFGSVVLACYCIKLIKKSERHYHVCVLCILVVLNILAAFIMSGFCGRSRKLPFNLKTLLFKFKLRKMAVKYFEIN